MYVVYVRSVCVCVCVCMLYSPTLHVGYIYTHTYNIYMHTNDSGPVLYYPIDGAQTLRI